MTKGRGSTSHVTNLVCSKVCEFEVEVVVEYAVLRFDVPMVHTPLMEVHHCQQCLREVVACQRLRETAHSAINVECGIFILIMLQ